MGSSNSTPEPAPEPDPWHGDLQFQKYAPGGEWEQWAPPIPPPQRSKEAYRSKFIGILRGYSCSALAETGCQLDPGDLNGYFSHTDKRVD